MQHSRPLPDETRRYIAMIEPYIQEVYPDNRSSADQLAMNLPGGFRNVLIARVRHNPRGYKSAQEVARNRARIHPRVAHLHSARYAKLGRVREHGHSAHGHLYASARHHGRRYAAVHSNRAAHASRHHAYARIQLASARGSRASHHSHRGVHHTQRGARFQLAMAATPTASFRLISEAMADTRAAHTRRAHPAGHRAAPRSASHKHERAHASRVAVHRHAPHRAHSSRRATKRRAKLLRHQHRQHHKTRLTSASKHHKG